MNKAGTQPLTKHNETMTNVKEFFEEATRKGFVQKVGRHDYNGLWSDDFQAWAEHQGFTPESEEVERDTWATRYISTFTHPDISATLVVRHIASPTGSKSSWRLSSK